MAGKTIGQLKRDKRSKKKKQADFLAHFSTFASVSRACRKSKVPRSNVYLWLNDQAEITFRELYEMACKEALGALEDEAVRRAYEGVLKPVYQGGKKVGNIKEYSDTLLIVLLKARAPEKYKDRVHKEITGKDGAPIEMKVSTITHNLVIKRCDK
jgi:hypothetical protein